MRAAILIVAIGLFARESVHANDSLTLAEAYINLSLTHQYFDTLSTRRIGKITSFIRGELSSINDTTFLRKNGYLYNFCLALLYLERSKLAARTRGKQSRSDLIKLKQLLDSAVLHFNKIANDDIETSSYTDLINYTNEDKMRLHSSLVCTRQYCAQLFNQNIYPDFQRQFNHFKQSGKICVDSLQYYSGLFSIELREPLHYCLHFDPEGRRVPCVVADEETGNLLINDQFYSCASALWIINEYLQISQLVRGDSPLDSIAVNNRVRVLQYELNLPDTDHFALTSDTCIRRSDMIPKDEFFRRQLDSAAIATLYLEIKIKHMKLPKPVLDDADGDGITDEFDKEPRYYFPDPAPFPSKMASVAHFCPHLKRLLDVNGYMVRLLNKSGYAGHFQYYYARWGGFAILTGLERINEKGIPLVDKKLRWELKGLKPDKFSLYVLFKSIFFEESANFRLMAFVVDTREARTDPRQPASWGTMTKLISYSHHSFPAGLDTVRMADKTLSVLIYHFFQSDVGEVPILDESPPFSVQDYLSGSALSDLLNHPE